MKDRETPIFDELRLYLKSEFKNDPVRIQRTRDILLHEQNKAPHLRFLSSHVLWHWVLNCDRDLSEIFPEEIFPQIVPEIFISLPKSVSKLSSLDLALIHGFFNAFNFCTIRTNSSNFSVVLRDLLEILFSTSVTYRPVDNFYHFTVLKNCLEKISRGNLSNEILLELNSAKQNMWRLCLRLVHSYWDNRYNGVSELSIDIFYRLVNLIHRKIDGNFIKFDILIENYIENFPFYVRGKYKIIAVLIEYCSKSEFEKIESKLFHSILRPLNSTHLSSAVGAVYKTILCYLGKNNFDENVVDRWTTLCGDCLCSKKRQLAFNAAKQFLPAVAKYAPNFLTNLEEQISERLKFVENSNDKNAFDVDISNLCSIAELVSAKNDAQVENLSDRVSWAYGVVLKYFLRIKGLIITETMRNFLFSSFADANIDLRIELFQICTDSTNFQHGIFLDDVLMAIFSLSNLTVSDSAFRRRMFWSFRKWIHFRIEKATKKNEICFFVFSTKFQHLINSKIDCLIRSIQNSSNDIRDTASKILSNYCTISDEIFEILIGIATNLSNSPKELDCESGATVWRLIFDKYFFDANRSLALIDSIEIRDQAEGIDKFCRLLKIRFEFLKTNLHVGAAKDPLHGFILSFSTFLRVCNERKIETTDSQAKFVLNTIDEISDHFLKIFGSSAEGECPSLEQMEISILSQCTDADKSIDFESNDDLSTDKQLILACCWLNIKDCAGVAAELSLCKFSPPSSAILILTRIGEIFYRMMTRTRHWGVLDGCSEGFSKFCKFCYTQTDAEIRRLPENILEKIFDSIASTKAGISVTRRSVGYPMMVQCIVVESYAAQENRILRLAFERLLIIANLTVDHDSDGLTDMAVVRAMHCLRLLLRCSSLGLDVQIFAADIFRLILKYFCSNLWPLRNSAVMMLSALTWRLFGRRNVFSPEDLADEDLSGSTATDIATSLDEFRSNFQEIWTICCSAVDRIVQNFKESGSAGAVHDPNMYPVFSVLQNICIADGVRDSQVLRDVKRLRENLFFLICQLPDHRLRRITAGIFSNFTPLKDVSLPERVLTLCDSCKNENRKNFNLEDGLISLAKFLISSRIPFLPEPDQFETENTLDAVRIEPKFDTFSSTIDSFRFFTRLYSEFRQNRTFSLRNWVKNENEKFLQFMTDCCSRKYGISAQCLALPIFTLWIVDDLQDSDSVSKWVEYLEQCSAEKGNETCRFSAAYSYGICGSLIWNEILPDAIRTRTFFNILHLLTDEDADVRDVATSIAKTFPNPNLMMRLDSYSCLTKLFDEISLKNINLCRSIFNRLEVSIEEIDCLEQNLIDIRSKHLFQQDHFNIYREEILLVSIYFKRISALIGDDSGQILESIADRRRSESIDILEKCVDKCLKYLNFKNVLCSKRSEILLIPIFKLKYSIRIWNCDGPKFEKFLFLFDKNFKNLFLDD